MSELAKSRLFWAMVLAGTGIIGFAIWDEATCAELGSPEEHWIMLSCGDDCWTMHKETYRPCVRRK